jgi:hypothetical protein
MDRDLTNEEKEKIINFGAFSYKEEKMAVILGWTLQEIEKEFRNKKSEFSMLYEKGKAVSEYLIDVKMFEMAKAGDLKAMEKYQLSKARQR